MFIKAYVTLQGRRDVLDNLGIKDKKTVFGSYPIYIRLSSIDAVYSIPDDDGIPLDNVARVALRGIEYTILYSYKLLLQQLNIINEDIKEDVT